MPWNHPYGRTMGSSGVNTFKIRRIYHVTNDTVDEIFLRNGIEFWRQTDIQVNQITINGKENSF